MIGGEEIVEEHSGTHMSILFERGRDGCLIRSLAPYPDTYMRAGAGHLVADIGAFMARIAREGAGPVRALPDRSATRATLEEAGFRGEGLMRYAPDEPPPIPTLDRGRPGAFGPDTRVRLEDGPEVPAASVHPGMRVQDGGRVEEVLLARVRELCRLDGGVYGVLNRVLTPAGPVEITRMRGAERFETQGEELVWLVTEGARVRSGPYLFEDMWGSPQLRKGRRISEAEVIAALNASEGR